MDIEKTVQCDASPAHIWQLLLAPELMAGCVPGVQSVEVLSADEYLATIKVKISFVTASFKIRTTLTERREPTYLRCEGQGEDAALASKLKHQTELFLSANDTGGCELKIVSHVDVLGRVGNFGLSAMKTKVDRMWDEFCVALHGKLTASVGG